MSRVKLIIQESFTITTASLIVNHLEPVNQWKGMIKIKNNSFIGTAGNWKSRKERLNGLLTLWEPLDPDLVYSVDLLVPLKDRKDIDSGLKFLLDSLQGKYYSNDRQVKAITINIHNNEFYTAQIKRIGFKKEWIKNIQKMTF